MNERIVVALHAPLATAASEPLGLLRAVVAAAEARGGELATTFATTAVVTFAPDAIAEAIRFLRGVLAGRQDTEPPWRVGVAQGDFVVHTDLHAPWGDAFLSAVALARRAAPGEALVGTGMESLPLLLTRGTRVARVFGAKVAGERLDLRVPFRKDAQARLGHLKRPEFLAADDLKSLLWPGALSLVRALPGAGGSRLLSELEQSGALMKAVSIEPSGVPLEPLGALRILATSAAENALSPHDATTVLSLRNGEGAPAEHVARWVRSLLPPDGAEAPGVLVLHDMDRLDASTIEVVARSIVTGQPVSCVGLLSPTAELPAALKALPAGAEATIQPLSDGHIEAMLQDACSGELDVKTARRYARRARGSPLRAMTELVRAVGSGEVVWIDGVARGRRPGVKPAVDDTVLGTVRQAFYGLSAGAREVLFVAASLGPDATISFIEEVLDRADRSVLLRPIVNELVQERFVDLSGERLRVVSETYARVAKNLGGDDVAERALALSLADVTAARGGPLRRAAAAVFAERAGATHVAAEHASAAFDRARELGYASSATSLAEFVNRLSPGRISADQLAARAAVDVAVAIPRSTLPKPSAPPPPRSSVVDADGAASRRAGTYAFDGAEASSRNRAEPPFEPRPSEPGGWDEDDTAVLQHDDFAKTRERPSAALKAAPPAAALPVLIADGEVDGGEAVGQDFIDDVEERTLLRASPAHEPASPPPPKVIATAGSALPPAIREVSRRVLTDVKAALMASDVEALEAWLTSDAAGRVRPHTIELLRGVVALSRSDVGDALRLLRRARASAGNESPEVRCQMSLALAMALAAGARHDEALLESLDALARARETSDEGAERASLALLAKLCANANRAEDATLLRRKAGIA